MEQKPSLFANSFSLSMRLVREQLTPLLILFAVSALFTLTSESVLRTLTASDDSSRWVVQVSIGLYDLLEGVMLMLVLSWGIPKVRDLTEAHYQQHPFQESYISSFLGEYLRLLANVLLYGLLLIIPGFLRYIRLVFVPYVALFARPYRQGQRDCLRLAADLTRGRYLKLLLIVLAFTAVQLGVEFAPLLEPSLHILPMRIVFLGISFFISIWLYSLLYLLFEQAMEEFAWN
ncbi:MAG: hypothetical protein KF799_11325 [Bdellovibrionales bacterium]|nr:hypothetical protein [Bdellovibrionales bacterium]